MKEEGFRERGRRSARIFNAVVAADFLNFSLLRRHSLVHQEAVFHSSSLIIVGAGVEEFVADEDGDYPEAAADGVDVGYFVVDAVDPEGREHGLGEFDEADLRGRGVLGSESIGDVDGANDEPVEQGWDDGEGRQEDGGAGRIRDGDDADGGGDVAQGTDERSAKFGVFARGVAREAQVARQHQRRRERHGVAEAAGAEARGLELGQEHDDEQRDREPERSEGPQRQDVAEEQPAEHPRPQRRQIFQEHCRRRRREHVRVRQQHTHGGRRHADAQRQQRISPHRHPRLAGLIIPRKHEQHAARHHKLPEHDRRQVRLLLLRPPYHRRVRRPDQRPE
mmetsp:Transcript_194/g.568  ORF Transcript_194/g.568 Transcript_194/m.568 type:complete len:336 (-) Transcript_194:117-1124(-)